MWMSNYEAGVVPAKTMFERWWKKRKGHAKRSEPESKARFGLGESGRSRAKSEIVKFLILIITSAGCTSVLTPDK